jgi:acetyl-CoA carboxylase biotin carboxyl carrier protein
MNIRKIKPLIEWLVEIGFTDIEIKEGEESLKLGRNNNPEPVVNPAYIQMPQQVAPHAPAPPPLDSKPVEVVKSTGHQVRSPMVGTMYTSPSPDAPSFVSVGQSVKVGDTLCIVEAMKMFNEIECDRAGVIAEVLVASGEPVEYDQPLFIIE